MILWIDAQLSPAIAPWINVTFDIQTQAVRDLGLRDAKDLQIFRAARDKKAVVMTKDAGFLFSRTARSVWTTATNFVGHMRKHIKR